MTMESFAESLDDELEAFLNEPVHYGEAVPITIGRTRSGRTKGTRHTNRRMRRSPADGPRFAWLFEEMLRRFERWHRAREDRLRNLRARDGSRRMKEQWGKP